VARSRLIRLLVTVLALGVILVAADLAARSYASGRFAGELRTRYDLPADPSVRVAGGSFLWQAVRGRFDDVTVDVGEMPAGKVTLRDVRVRIPEVDVPLGVLVGGSGTVDLAAGTVRGQVSYADLAQQVSPGGLRVDLARAGDAIRATTTVRVFTLEVPLSRAERLLEAAGFGGWSIALSDVPPQVDLDAFQVADSGVLVSGTLGASAVDVD
jgi:hypothetical protein